MSEVWKLEKDLCRLCHSEGSFHNLLQPRIILGHQEYYLEMLRQSFDIELEPVPGVINEITFTICETCIVRLRDATNFKQQVLLCEKRFKEVYKDILKALTPSENSKSIIKVEVPCSFQESLETPSTLQDNIKVEVDRLDGDDDDFPMDFDDEDNEPLFDLKKEDTKKSKPSSKAKKTSTKTNKTRNTKAFRQAKKKPPAESQSGEAEGEAAEGEKPKKGRKIKFRLKESDYEMEGDDFVCAHCNIKNKNKYSLRNHIMLKHYNIKRAFVCTYCEKEYHSIVQLNAHKLDEHNINDRHQCLACYAEFNTKQQLIYHTNVYHMLGEKIKCENCEYETFSVENMRKHKVKHKSTKEFHCRFCKKSFLRKTTLNFHERIHTGDKQKVCKECGQAFVQKASLNYHMAKYHPGVKF